jgi:hypothetical protein
MKALLLIASIIFVTTTHAGEIVSNDMYCDKTETIFETLKKDYNEVPVLLGKAYDMAKSTMTFWTNSTTDSWTIVATKDETSCIIGVGEKLKIIDYKRKKNI